MEKFFLPSGDQSVAAMESRFPLGADRTQDYHRFRGDDLALLLGFGLSYFFDATQRLWSEMLLKGNADMAALRLPSGWTAKRLGLGRVWETHLEFTSPQGDSGFIMRGNLNMVERKLPGAKPKSISDLVASLRGESKNQRLFKENKTSDECLPEDSDRIVELSLHQYEKTSGGRFALIEQLEKGNGSSIWRYRPQVKASINPSVTQVLEDGDTLLASVNSATHSLDASTDALSVLGEYLNAHDAVGYRTALRDHADTRYFTLDKNDLELFSIVRPTLSSPTFTTQEFPDLLNRVWLRAAAIGVMDQLEALKASSGFLIENGHVLLEQAVSHDDELLFAQAEGRSTILFLAENEMTTAYVVEEGRVTILDVDPDTLTTRRIIADFDKDGMAITNLNQVSTKLGEDHQRLAYGLHSVVSFYDTEVDVTATPTP